MRGFVYFLFGGGFTKIGKTTRAPEQRIADFAPKLPFDTKIVHVIKCKDVDFSEGLLHKLFKTDRVRGEWFKFGGPDLQNIQSGTYDSIGDAED